MTTPIGVAVSIDLVVRDRHGNIKSQWCSGPNDLTMSNWITFLRGLCTPTSSGANRDVTMKDEGGTNRTFRVWFDVAVSMFNTSGEKGPKICLGNGGGSAVTPVRSNYNLVNQLYEAFTTPAASGANTVAHSSTFINNSGGQQTIREAGLKFNFRETAGTAVDVLMFHDATAATVVENGESVTATYTWTWP